MGRKGLLAILFALLAALVIGQGASVSAQAVASITLPSPGTTKQLYEGCNNISLTFLNGTSSGSVVQAVDPPSAVESMWRHDAQARKWDGFSPASAAASDLRTVSFLDAVWLCVSAPAAPPPAAARTATATPVPVATAVPVPTATPVPVPTAIPTQPPPEAAGFAARKTSSYVSSIGTLHVVGEVVNNNSFDAEFVRINGTFFDSSDNVLASDFTFSCLDTVPAGGDSPFDLLVIDAPPGIARYTLQVDDRPADEPPPSGLQISGVTTNVSSIGTFHVLGLVTNNSSVTYEFVQICGALYDAAGNVIRAGFTFTQADTLAPGQSSSFDYLEMDAPPVSSYRLWVEGRPQ